MRYAHLEKDQKRSHPLVMEVDRKCCVEPYCLQYRENQRRKETEKVWPTFNDCFFDDEGVKDCDTSPSQDKIS